MYKTHSASRVHEERRGSITLRGNHQAGDPVGLVLLHVEGDTERLARFPRADKHFSPARSRTGRVLWVVQLKVSEVTAMGSNRTGNKHSNTGSFAPEGIALKTRGRQACLLAA